MTTRHPFWMLGWIFLLPQLAGCSLYLTRPVDFYVIDAETQRPIAGAKVEAFYSVMLDFGLLFAGRGPLDGETRHYGT